MREQEAIEHLLCVIRRVGAGGGFMGNERFADAALHGLEGIARGKLKGLPEREWDDCMKWAYEQAGHRLPKYEWNLSSADDVSALIRKIEPDYKRAVANNAKLPEKERLALQWYPAAVALRHCLWTRKHGFGSDVVRKQLIPELHSLAYRLLDYEAILGRRKREKSRDLNDARTTRISPKTERKLQAVYDQLDLQRQNGEKRNISTAVSEAATVLGMKTDKQVQALYRLFHEHKSKAAREQ